MDGFERLRQVVEADGQPFMPLCLIGVTIKDQQATMRIVADELLLAELLRQTKGDRQWLHLTVDNMCDGLKPPDDQAKETIHIILEELA